MVILVMAAALALEVGRVAVVDAELQLAADAAALAGASAFGDAATDELVPLATARATSIANANKANNRSVTLRETDVIVGVWNPELREFTPGIDESGEVGPNAVRVVAHACEGRDTHVEPLMSHLSGRSFSHLDLHAEAIAYRLSTTPPSGFLGLDGFRSTGVLTTAAVEPNGHPHLLSRPLFGGHIRSNGDVNLHVLGLAGLSLIRGDVYSGGTINRPVIDLLTRITGQEATPAEPYSCPAVPPSLASSNNDNDLLPSHAFNGSDFTALGVVDLQPGTYHVSDFTVLAGAIVNVRGPVRFVITGKTTVLGSVLSLNRRAGDLRLLVAGDEAVDLAATADLYTDLYAPESDVRITAGLRYTGRIIGKEVNILATSFLYADPALGDPFEDIASIQLVR